MGLPLLERLAAATYRRAWSRLLGPVFILGDTRTEQDRLLLRCFFTDVAARRDGVAPVRAVDYEATVVDGAVLERRAELGEAARA